MATAEKERTTIRLQRCLDRVHDGDFKAQDEMIELAWERLLALGDMILCSCTSISQEDKEDIFQRGITRFWESMKKITPRDLRGFFSLASLQIRRTLVDTIRHHFGPRGPGANEVAWSPGDSQQEEAGSRKTETPENLMAWKELHEQIDALPGELREVFELTWYHELTQEEIAKLLGICSKTVRSRWRDARIQLYERLDGNLPG